MLRKLFSNGIRQKIIFFTILQVFIGLYLLFFTALHQQKVKMTNHFSEDSKRTAEILAHDMASDLLSNDIYEVNQDLLVLKKIEYVLFAIVLRNDGTVFADYNGENGYQYLGAGKQALQVEEPTFIDRGDLWLVTAPIQPDKESIGRILLGIKKNELVSVINSTRNTFIVTTILIFIFIIISLSIFASRIVKPLKLLEDSARKVINGDENVEIDVRTHDEVKRLADVFNTMIKKIRNSLAEVNKNTQDAQQAAQEANAARSEALSKQQYLSTSVEKMLIQMNRFAAGDLTVQLTAEQDDEINKLYEGFNKAVKNIAYMVAKVDDASTAVVNSGHEISTRIEQMSVGTQEQSHQTTEVASSVEQMTKTIQESAAYASHASETALLAKEQANKGVQVIEETKTGMEDIVKSSLKTGEIIASLASRTDQIGEITQVINDIADQTNLLALNAAIEAARAGDQGRGFAVVADEVRKLAERTTKATKEIANMIKTIQNEAKEADGSMAEAREAVKQGMKQTEVVATAFQDILKSVDTVSETVMQVATAAEEQSATSIQISKNVEGINDITQQSAVGIQQIAQTAEQLRKLMVNLQQLLRNFTLNQVKSKNLIEHDKESYSLLNATMAINPN